MDTSTSTSTPRGGKAQELLIVVQLVVLAIKRLSEFPGSGSKTCSLKEEAT